LASESTNRFFFEGDKALPWYNRLFGFFCKDVRMKWLPRWLAFLLKFFSVEYFLRVHLLKNILTAAPRQKYTIMAQALYFKDHRAWLRQALINAGYRVLFVQVKTSLEQQNKQLYSRRFGTFWRWYAKQNRPYFQTTDGDLVIDNQADTPQLQKISNLLG
jgi:hypothetical protein